MYTLKKIFTLILVLAGVSALAQENAIKVGFTDALFGNYNIGYERWVNENNSITIKAGFWKPSSSPFISEDLITPEAYTLQDVNGGASISAEYRFYFGNHPKAGGLYIAPYLRYFGQSVMFTDEIDGDLFDVDSKLNTIGIGGQLGYQLVINDAFLMDFYFFGAGIDRYNVKLKYTLQEPQSGFDYNTITDDVSEVFEDINYLESRLEHHVNNDNLISKLPFLFPGFRIGMSIGYTF